jgi:hypothetical protein
MTFAFMCTTHIYFVAVATPTGRGPEVCQPELNFAKQLQGVFLEEIVGLFTHLVKAVSAF